MSTRARKLGGAPAISSPGRGLCRSRAGVAPRHWAISLKADIEKPVDESASAARGAIRAGRRQGARAHVVLSPVCMRAAARRQVVITMRADLLVSSPLPPVRCLSALCLPPLEVGVRLQRRRRRVMQRLVSHRGHATRRARQQRTATRDGHEGHERGTSHRRRRRPARPSRLACTTPRSPRRRRRSRIRSSARAPTYSRRRSSSRVA